jgi:hypothetical protein
MVGIVTWYCEALVKTSERSQGIRRRNNLGRGAARRRGDQAWGIYWQMKWHFITQKRCYLFLFIVIGRPTTARLNPQEIDKSSL